MVPKKIKIRQENKSVAVDYLKKAIDNYEQMLVALRKTNYNSVGTLALQCAISSADAIRRTLFSMRGAASIRLSLMRLQSWRVDFISGLFHA